MAEILEQADGLIPIVYTGVVNQSSVVLFDYDFTTTDVMHFINDMERIRQLDGYSKVKIYYRSNGGDADALVMMADYLNNFNKEVDLIVIGMVCSCGFYLLPMISNPLVNIVLTPTSCGMLHLVDIILFSRELLSNNKNKESVFNRRRSDDLNEWLLNNYATKLGLTESDLEAIRSGEDVYLNREELRDALTYFHDRMAVESGEVDTAINDISDQIKLLTTTKRQLNKVKSTFK